MNTIKEHKRADLVLDARAVALESRAATRRKRSLVHPIGREMSAPHATVGSGLTRYGRRQPKAGTLFRVGGPGWASG